VETGLEGSVALVTGAASGIGRACAAALVAEGARVVVADLDGEAVNGVGEEIAAAAASPLDVTDPADVDALVGHVADAFGALDAVVTCAGVFHATPFDQITPDEWDRIQAVNLRGTFLTCQAAVKAMIPNGRGRIVTLASLAGQVGGLAAGASYAASKAGVVALTKSIARFAGPHGITANCVNPGVIETPMIAAWPPDVRERTVTATPLGRVGTPEEVAAVVVWLASDGAAFVHGAHVDVNGGLHMD
jgi:3-oxoacyl-[acyl-carrier protein] reductase